MSELKDILERYSILIEAMVQLEQEVPIIEKEYQRFKESIKEQIVITDGAILSIENKATSTIKEFQEFEMTQNAMLKRQEDNIRLIENSMKSLEKLLHLADEKINTLKILVAQQTVSGSGNKQNENSKMVQPRIDYEEMGSIDYLYEKYGELTGDLFVVCKEKWTRDYCFVVDIIDEEDGRAYGKAYGPEEIARKQGKETFYPLRHKNFKVYNGKYITKLESIHVPVD